MRYLFLLCIVLLLNEVCVCQSDYVIMTGDEVINTLKSTLHVIPETSSVSELSPSELELVNELVEEYVENYNSMTEKSFNERGEGKHAILYKIKKLKKYRIQYVPYLNDQRVKEIWINGFCNEYKTDWENEIVFVMDGGNCFFQIRLNLLEKKCIEIGTNGYA